MRVQFKTKFSGDGKVQSGTSIPAESRSPWEAV